MYSFVPPKHRSTLANNKEGFAYPNVEQIDFAKANEPVGLKYARIDIPDLFALF